MSTPDLKQTTLAELARGLAAGDYSASELTRSYLERIAKLNEKLNVFMEVSEETAMNDAKAADERIAAGSAGVLTGIPIAHKDIFCTETMATRCGSKMLENFVPPYSATVVKNLQQAGVVTLGKLNMDEFAMGSSNENSAYGPVRNPWNTDYVPGGSSGGSAAAVAAGLVAASTGTDTGGSIRQPASFTGVTGLKPTYGRVSRLGMVAFASSLDQGGPLARTAEDCAIMLQAMAGHDPADSTSANVEVPNYRATLGQPLKGLRIGLPKAYFGDGLDAGVDAVLQQAISDLKAEGVLFEEVEMPHADVAVAAYYIISSAECSSNLSRFDGVRYGHRCHNPADLYDLYARSRSEGFGDEVKRRILLGTYALSAGYYDAYYRKAQQVRRKIAGDFESAFSNLDLLLAPVAPTPAFKIGEKTDDPVSMYLSDVNTVAVSLAGLPAISVPAGFNAGLPVGMQLIAPHFGEAKLLAAAHQYQQITNWHMSSPEGSS